MLTLQPPSSLDRGDPVRAGEIARVRCETAGAEELASDRPSVNRGNVFRALNLRSP